MIGESDDPTEYCLACRDLWHRWRTGEENGLEELRNIHMVHADIAHRLEEARDLVADLAGTVAGLTGRHRPVSAETYRREKVEWCRRVLARAEVLLALSRETPSVVNPIREGPGGAEGGGSEHA